MALTLQQVRTLPAFADMSDKDIINHAKAHGFDTSAMQPETSNDEAGAIRSYGTIPLLKGVADVGGAVGYGLEAAGIKDWGQALQKSNQDVQSTLTARQSQQAQEDAKKTIIDENGNYGGYNLGTLSQDVMGSLPAMAPMAALGAPLAKVATMGSTALGVGEKLAKISSTGALGKGLAAGLDTAIGSGVGFGASEGIYSGASNAAQVQNEIRNTDINKLAEHPIFADTYHNETDKSLSPEERLNQTRDILASKAGDDVFAKTAIRTGLISMATGGGVFGMMRGKATGHSLLAAEDGPLKTAAKGFALEGLAQELPQSAWEQRVQNEAKRDYADPNQDVNEGVINAGVQGGIAGGVMGLFGGAGGSKARPDAGNKKGETGVLDSIDTSNTDAPLADKADPQALRPWEEPSYADYKNQSEPDNQGYVPAEDGTLWESPDLNDLQTQADRASKLTAFHEKEQADIAQKDAELKAMALRADNTPEQTRSYRKKRLELRAKSDQLNKDLAEALKEATQTSFGPEVKNTQLSDQLQEKLNVNPTRNPTTKTNIGVTSELNPTDASTGTESGNSDTTTSAENPTTDQATTGKLTNDSLSSENQSRPDDVTKQSESALGQGDQRDDGSFIPTHTLNDGTPVQHLENNSYVDKHGEEWQADDAIKLPLTENKTDISTKNAKNTDKKSLNEKIDDQSSQTTNEASQEESGKENANVKEIENNGKEESPFVKVTDPNGKAFNVLKTDLAGDQDRIPTFSAISGKRLPTPILRADINHESLTNENISRQMEVPASGDISNSPSGTATSELQNNESQISRGKVQSEAGAGEDVAIEKFRQQLKKTGVAKDAMDNTWKVQQDANNQLYGEKITPIGERTDTTDRFNNHQDVINHITDNLANHAVTLSPIKQPLNTEATESVGNSSKSIDSSSNGQANKLPSEIASQNTQVQLPSKLFDNPIKSLDGLSTRDFVANHVNENTQFSEDNGKYYLGGTTGAGLKQVSKAVHTYGKAYQQHLTTALDDQAKTSAEAKQSDTPTFEAVSTTPEEQTTTSEPAKENANTIQANADVSKNGENVDTENIKPIDDKTKSNLENRFKENLNIINNPDESLSKESYVKHNNDIIAIAEKHGDTEFANQLKALQFNKSDSVQADSGKKEALIFSDNKNADPILPKGTVKGGMEEIGNLVDNVLSGKIPGNEKSAVRYDVELKNDQDIKEKTGLDISGYVHSVDSFAILKVNKDHGNEKKEASRGQLPITKEDWVRIPDVVANYDNVEHGGKDSYGKDLIRYTKSYPDGVTRYVEEVRNGRGELSAKTMWKTRTASSNAVSKEIPLALTSETASRNIPHDDKSIAPSPENATDSSGKITKAKAYHPAIEAYANDLVEGGGSAFTYDEYGKINGRTPSLNPEWFKDGRFQIYKPDGALYASTPSVKEVKQAVDDYKSGKNLKAKQIAILESLHDMAVSDDEQGSNQHEEDIIYDDLTNKLDAGLIGIDDIEAIVNEFDDSIPFDVKGPTISLNEFENWLGITNEKEESISGGDKSQGQLLQEYTESELAKHERDQAERARKEAEAELKAKQKAESDKGIDSLADEMLGTYGTNDLFGGNPLANLGQNDTVPSDKVTQKGKVLADKANENIQDVGEKLEGAKKFTYTLKESLSDDVDVSSVPLSKSFPQPDYEKLVESGVKSQTAAMIAVMRAEIPTKPQKGYKVKSWTEQVSMIRGFANDLLSNKISVDDVINQARKISNFENLPDILNIADQINPARIRDLGSFRLAKRFWGLYEGKRDITKWEVTTPNIKSNTDYWSKTKHFDTKEEALNYIRDQVTKTGDDTVENGKTYTKFDIWTQRGEEGVFVGKKIAPNKFIVLKNLPSLKEARQYVSEHNAELVEQLKEKKQTKDVRRAENNERVGKDYRNGKNVTAAEFGDAFGFRGVQFGNWVNNDRRQQDLNNAYDGLMDLADVLNIPPKAIGLNGELGLAFGARGSGGVDPAAAHYESGQVVINLTKNHGAGSLAHEWWHAVDNYFGKQEKSGYLTEAYSGRNPYQVRQEVYQAWTGITEAIKKETQLAKRSAMKDRNRARDYWSTVIEMTARSFERYVIGKLEDQGYSNDYLANIIPESVWEADAKIEDSDYAFPLQSEMDAVNKAYDKLFDILQTRETDKGVELYSKLSDPATHPHTKSTLHAAITKALDKVFGNGWTQRLMDTGKFKIISREEASKLVGQSAMFHKVWHGTPHNINKFSSNKIGTGEGAQAFGYGLYFTDKKEIAQWYRDRLTNDSGVSAKIGLFGSKKRINYFDFSSPQIGQLFFENKNIDYLLSKAKEGLSYYESEFEADNKYRKENNYPKRAFTNPIENIIANFKKDVALLEKIKSAGGFDIKGNVYEVELAPSQDEYLDWDRPLSEQSYTVKEKLGNIIDLLNERRGTPKSKHPDLTYNGSGIYGYISNVVDGDKAASDYLHSLGIRGIRYKAEGGKSEANNYVIFDENDINIEAKYSKDGHVLAFYNPKDDTTYFVHDNISKDANPNELKGLVAHEIAVHALHLGKTKEAFKSLLKRFDAMKATNPNVQEAFDRVPADTKAEDKLEEALAYFIENNHDSNLAQKILEAFRQLVRAIGNTLVGKDKFLFSHWANKLTEQELRNMAVSALRSAPDNLQFDNVGRENKGVRLSQSAMKSVEANIKRGRDAMTKALLDKTTVHRAMFRQGMGWIDFEWGDEGGDITSKGKRPGAKGIAHIIEARQRKDRLSNQQTENLLFDLVDTIAKGEEIERYSYDHVTNIKIVNNNIMVMLTRKEGNNAWIVTGFEIHKPDSGKTGNDVLPPTHSESTLTRNEAGAGVRNIPQQDDNSSDNGIKFSRSTPANSDSDNSAIKDIFTKISGDHGLDWLGGLFTRNQLIDFIAKDVPEMMNYKLLSQAKDNATHEREQQVAKAYEAMSKKIQEAAKKPNGWTDYAKARRMMMELSRVQSMATNLENFDPAEAKPNQAMNEQEREVYDAYQALNDQQKEVYIKMRDDYRSDLKETQEALIENLDRFPVDSHTKSAVIADIKAHFDKALNKGVYFPLARFGKIVVTGVNPEGELVTSFVESNGARDKLMAKMDAQGYHQVRSQLKAEYDADVANGNAAHTIAALATNTIEQIRDNLVEDQGNKVAGNVKDMLDAFNQELIKALPDSSFRKHFIHRKGTLGESADTLRAYANTRTSTAKGLASIGYDHQIAEVLQNGRKAIRALNLRNSDFLDSVMNEFTKREKALKTTSIQPWAQTLTSLGFMGALGFNVASAGVNMLQVAAIGLPELAGRHGFNASSIAISKAYKLLGDAAVLNWESGFDLMKNPKINAKTKEALQRLHDIGKIDLNQTHDSISAGQNPSYSTNAVTRAFGYTAKKSGYFFHVAEALNRQVMGIAAFELEYKKNGGDFEKALAYTVKAIDDTQYDYGQGNRSRFMMGNTARVLTLFKAYALNTSWFIGRNAALSLAKLPSDERLQARKTLAVTMAMSFATSGLFGMPIGIEAFAGIGGVAGFKYKGAYGALAGSVLGMAVFQALLAGLGADDDDELETEFRNWLTDNFNQTVAEFITKGPARLLPIGDISGRTSMNHLWHQPQNKELEGRDEFNAISNTLMGPVASQIANVFMASKLWADGETGRALEAMTPRAVSNLIAADRLATHGVETIKGDKIVDRDLTVNEIAQKMLGFNPTVIANANDANSAITKERDKIDMEKQHLVKRYLSADTEERARLFNEDIKDFNEEVPASARITKMSLFRSMKARRGANKHTENGLYLSKKQQYLRKIGRFAEQE